MTSNEYRYKVSMESGFVPFIQGRPGEAKSAIIRQIAEEQKFQYIDLRLSTMEETDLGLYPVVNNDQFDKPVMRYAVPDWADKAKNYQQNNYEGTLIHFEELNRCREDVRNAALGILLERIIAGRSGYLADRNIWLCASGNLGSSDGCDVEEFDVALNGRLIHFTHRLDIPTWRKNFAEKNINSYILRFLDHKPEYFWQRTAGSEVNAYASARTWTFLSGIMETLKKHRDNNMVKVAEDLTDFAESTIGTTVAVSFLTWLNKTLNDEENITWKDVINGSLNKKDKKWILKNIQSDNVAEIMQSLKEISLDDLSHEWTTNISIFLSKITEDLAAGYLYYIAPLLPNKDERLDIIEKHCSRLIENLTDDRKNKNKNK